VARLAIVNGHVFRGFFNGEFMVIFMGFYEIEW
jgi:hypothetical protein